MQGNIIYGSTKTYEHSVGLSVAFRQWKAESHCRLLHGYALSVRIEFEAAELDKNNWVIDFGGLKEVKDFLVSTFDHKLVIAYDDPELNTWKMLQDKGMADIVVSTYGTGCEMFAKLVYAFVGGWLERTGQSKRVFVAQVEVKEHGGNSGYVKPNIVEALITRLVGPRPDTKPVAE